ncbi:phosphoethanolamine transferase [Halarcobacter mediterraneus]|uniref:Phosphoethanolamine transferase n=1 Tax=Halarcobacter mediterraneus TaxID=2023153 RepID=A0A4Q1AX90_9BACT|nr:phosphoethanolamine--lipid A transferase [Halarcobacter mediterraneus]RXK12771.1 phosphoethanolamine transferase [Halarcobacter mediterraneus]
MKKISQYKLIIYISLLFTVFYNFSFFRNFSLAYSFTGINILYTISIFFTLFLFISFVLSLLSSRYYIKPFLIILLMVSSFTAYFMDTYNVIIDKEMIRNALETNLNESLDLFSFQLVLYVIFLGIIPSFLVYKTNIDYGSFKKESFRKIKTLLLILLLIVITLFSTSKFYTSFFREHKTLKYYANPTYWMFAIVNYTKKTYFTGKIIVKKTGDDALIDETPEHKKELIVMVVGEATRADRFSLNGYKRDTNPLLEKEEVYNFSNMSSCGTSTAYSVPCMFSKFTRDNYSHSKAVSNENLLDVLKHTKDVNILWRDNNSSSKGVAVRVKYEDYKSKDLNTICENGECRDEGMLIGLDKFIKDSKSEDIFIILHQMGNHGPAYYKRYPERFEKFKPICKTNQLEKCTKEEISNAYDNAILHTDYFLSQVIDFLKPYSNKYDTAMFYMSDHGESLGENGIYLHGMPYFMAPKEQTHVASLMWFGDSMKRQLDLNRLNSIKNNDFSQDNLFHTILGLFEVQTDAYNKKLDILSTIRKEQK